MPLLCIDARFWGIKHTGIGRYVQNLISHLPDSGDITVVLIVHPDQANEPQLAGYRKIIARHHPYSLSAQLEMLVILAKLRPRLLHVPHFTIPVFWPGKMIITIHDLIKHLSRGPETSTRSPGIYWFKYLIYRLLVSFALVRASHILVPAQYWKSYLQRHFHIQPDKITVTYEGVSPVFFQDPQLTLDLPDYRPFVIHVGNVYPHKNIPTLLSAIKLLQGEVLLIMVCARSVFSGRISALISNSGIEKWVKFVGSVDDAQLTYYLKSSLALVFPSFIEGFGLPGLEAMAAGTAVVAADASCLPEIYGPAALYFDPNSPKELAQKINSLLTHPRIRQHLISKGKSQVRKYSWTKMAQKTWSIYLHELP